MNLEKLVKPPHMEAMEYLQDKLEVIGVIVSKALKIDSTCILSQSILSIYAKYILIFILHELATIFLWNLIGFSPIQ